MKSYTIIGKTVSKHMFIVILHFGVKNMIFEQKQFHLSKLMVHYGNKSNGYKNNLWKFEFDPIISLNFTGIWILKYKEIRVSGAKLFFDEYMKGIFKNWQVLMLSIM